MSQTYAVTTVDDLKRRMDEAREAQKIYAKFTEEQVDVIFRAAAKAAEDAKEALAKDAVEETGMGIVADKIVKNDFASRMIYNQYKDTKTCGVLEYDEEKGIEKLAEPIGLIAAVIPTTNPTSTAIFKTLLCLKTRNALVISPHPRAKKCTIDAAKIVNDAAVKAGAPEGLIGWIDQPALDMTNLLMRESDCILATGGPGMVHAAYSSGKPALGVGAGNVPAVIDSSADIEKAVDSIITSKTFDNGMICASEQSVTAIDDIYDKVKETFAKKNCYFLNDEEKDKVRRTILINGALNARIVGQPAAKIAKMAGVDVPEDTKILIGEVESTDMSEAFAHEKLSPVLGMYHAKDFDQALDIAETLVMAGGPGHTSSLHIDPKETEKIAKFADRMNTCRILINTPSSQGGIGGIYNANLTPSMTLGCGSWGGNSIDHNVGVMDLINVKTVAARRDGTEKVTGTAAEATDVVDREVFEKRALKTVYREGGLVYKQFNPNHPKHEVINEAYIQSVVESTGFPVPKVMGVSQIDGGWTISMEYVPGKTLQQLMDENPDKIDEYLDKFVDIQLDINKVKANRLRQTLNKMEDSVNSLEDLDPSTKYEIMQRIHGMKHHTKLCHGDLVPSNVIIKDDGSYVVLDWSHGTKGNAGADAAISYMRFCLENPSLAEKYLKLYSKKSGLAIQYIQKWMPIVAAAQLTKKKPEEKELLESWVSVAEYQ